MEQVQPVAKVNLNKLSDADIEENFNHQSLNPTLICVNFNTK